MAYKIKLKSKKEIEKTFENIKELARFLEKNPPFNIVKKDNTENWLKIKKQPKSKAWITAEYSNTSSFPHKTILVYEEDEDKRKLFGNYRVWYGNTGGDDFGEYYSFKTKAEALAFAKKFMRTH
jgi:hypothetical protein